jgi:hypothetical protein
MNNSLLETDMSESPPPSNGSDIGVLRRQMKEQQIRLEACTFSPRLSILSIESCIIIRPSWIK